MKKACFMVLIFAIVISGCTEEQGKINLSIIQEPDIREDDLSVKAAIAPVISPKESYIYYEDTIRYFSEKLDRPVRTVQRRSYREINELIEKDLIDFAFVCSGAYIYNSSSMELLVAPQMYGKTTYNSYIIVPAKSNYSSLSDLRGKRFAFSDPLSNTGWLYPEYRLALINETPESFFGKDEKGNDNYFFTYSHDYTIIAVAEELADGAAVDSLVYEYMKTTKPDIIAKTRIIETSPPFGIPPVVVSKDIDPSLKQRLSDIFLNMDKDEEGKKVLSGIKIDRFVFINDSAYDSVREMRNRIQ